MKVFETTQEFFQEEDIEFGFMQQITFFDEVPEGNLGEWNREWDPGFLLGMLYAGRPIPENEGKLRWMEGSDLQASIKEAEDEQVSIEEAITDLSRDGKEPFEDSLWFQMEWCVGTPYFFPRKGKEEFFKWCEERDLER